MLRKALSPSGCATPLELGGLLDGSLAHATSARLKDHVWKCARCQTELMLLKEFEQAAPRPEEERAVKWISARLERRLSEPAARPAALRIHPAAPPPRHSWCAAFKVGGLAVGAATLAVAVTIGFRENRTPELKAPSPAATAVLRSAAIAGLSPAGELDAAPNELRWEPRVDAASYSIQVTEVDQVEIWSAETREPNISLPPAVRTTIVPGKPLVWEVVAKDAAGRTIAWSGKQRFRIRMQAHDQGGQ